MKRIISIILVILMMLLPVSCKNQEVNNNSSNNSKLREETVIITPTESNNNNNNTNSDETNSSVESTILVESTPEYNASDNSSEPLNSTTSTEPVHLPHKHKYVGKITKNAGCKTQGVKTFTCYCGNSYTEEIAAVGHNWSEWKIIKEPTVSAEGNSQKKCKTCGETENKSIDKLSESTTVVVTKEHMQRIEEGFLRLINDERRLLGIETLTTNSSLDKAAQSRSVEIMEVFDHYRPNGKFFTTIVDESTYPYYALNENIVKTSHLGDGSRVQNDPWIGSDEQIELAYSWMFYIFKNSPSHYETIKNPIFNETGVGISYVIDKDQSIPYFYVAHIFGVCK